MCVCVCVCPLEIDWICFFLFVIFLFINYSTAVDRAQYMSSAHFPFRCRFILADMIYNRTRGSWSLLYSAALFSLRSQAILHAWIALYSALTMTALAWLVQHETAAVSARSVYTMRPCNRLKIAVCLFLFWFYSTPIDTSLLRFPFKQGKRLFY